MLGRWRLWLWPLMSGGVALGLLAGSAAAIVVAQGRASRDLQADVALAKLRSAVDGLRYLPDRYVTGIPVDTGAVNQEVLLQGQASQSLARLAGVLSVSGPLAGPVKSLSAGSEQEMSLLRVGRSTDAQRVLADTVKPAYKQIVGLADGDDSVLSAQARAADGAADRLVIGTGLARGLLFVLVLVVIEKARRRRIRSIAEREALRDSEERFQALVQNSSDVIAVVGDQGAVSFAACSVEAVLGYPPVDLEGSGLSGLVHPDDAARFRRVCEVGSRQGEELRVRHRDGSWRTCETRATDLRDHPGVRGVVLNIRDLSERKALEIELVHAQKLEAVGRLAAGVAHEINTPIQFVGDNIHFLHDAFGSLTGLLDAYRSVLSSEEPLSWEQRRRALDEAEVGTDGPFWQDEVPAAAAQALDGVRRVSSIVRAMKAFGHPDQGEAQVTDLEEALRNTMEIARNETKYVAEVVTHFGAVPPVMCVASDINQVFLNLLVNAADSIADEVGGSGIRGTITVTTAHDPGAGTVSISVADTGAGIPADVAERIFEPFFTTKDVGRGTGQGLALALRVVSDHHGTISFQPTLGGGTTFTVRLPVEDHDADQSRPLAMGAARA